VADRSDRDSRWPLPERQERRSGHSSTATSRAIHADIPTVEAVLLDGNDDKANLLGVKDVGELRICGSGAALANAVFNATGVRVRDFAITLEKILPHLPPTPADDDVEERGPSVGSEKSAEK